MVSNKELRILAFTGAGEDVFIRHYEVGELADTAEKNIGRQEETKKPDNNPIKELHGFHKMLLKIRDLDAIVVAGINGNTAGGGCEFSLGCDLRVMSSGDYFIGLPETSVGILPGGGGTQRLARLIGSSRALDLILHGQLISNVKALEFGIINEILPKESFLKSLKEYCQILANRAPIALREVKRAIHRGMDLPLEEALLLEQEAFNKTMNSKDAAKAMRTMLNSKEEIDVISKLEWTGE
ncbi:uncharacterized protein METZ01_LOCUS40523 [marine metagenome]|uniref:Enoyl-CoA hydratase n=1 Tax=marine metagenome TaxID=408172 RepID=A0A381RA05_9ZZZZ